ncbi:MAG: hypothetical protein NT166_02050 [Candidatus Aminicenantes bacterium]|nr:hypothetical protein [Candidatus Aminicenantes bacterium]
MRKRHHTKIIHEGEYVAEVAVELIDPDEGWSPYLSLDDALKLDEVREALREGALKKAAKISHVFTLIPVAV